VWVSAATVPVLFPGGIPQPVGYLVIAGGCAAGVATYVIGLRTLRSTGVLPVPLRTKARQVVSTRIAQRRRRGEHDGEPAAPEPPREWPAPDHRSAP
jgi:hypothetical protein